MKIIRVFPRKTKATPIDENVRINELPGILDEADEIHISVAFTWDKIKAEILAERWKVVAPVKIGGPAYGDPGGEFEPGMYLKPGYVITSRGCPNHCWFCQAWRNEGNIRELRIKNGWNLLDNNILACSKEHQEKVFEMLLCQERKIYFTGGLEAARFTDWHAEWFIKLGLPRVYFAYDTSDDWEPLVLASEILKKHNLMRKTLHMVRCYVLIGYPNDTIEKAEFRLNNVLKLGIMPFAMLYNHGFGRSDKSRWIKFNRLWQSRPVVGAKMNLIYQEKRKNDEFLRNKKLLV